MTEPRQTPHATRWTGRILSATLTVASLAVTATSFQTGAIDALLSGRGVSLPAADPVQIEVPSQERSLVCAGPVVAFIPQDVQPRAFGAPDLFGQEGVQSALESPGLLNQLGEEGVPDAALPVLTYSAGSETAASSVQRWNTETLRGLAVAPCEDAQAETWLIGGSTITGRQAVLSLANPSHVAATVDVRVFGASGEIDAPGARGILLPPQTRRVFSVAGFAPEEPSPVLQVTSSSSPIVATMHLQVTRGLQADGMAIVWGGASPSTTHALPGVWLEQGEVAAALRSSEGYEDLGAALRLLAPAEDTTARITVHRPLFGDVVSEVSLVAGRVLDVALDELGSSVVAVTVEADHPVVAGVRQFTAEPDRTDFSWVAAQEAWTGSSLVSVPPGPEATLSLIGRAVDTAVVTVDRIAPDGSTVLGRSTLEVSPERVALLSLGATGGLYRLETEGSVSAAVVVREPGGLGHLGVTLPSSPPEPVTVFTR